VEDVTIDMEFEKRLKEALKSKESFKTADCLDDTTLGLYIEDKLSMVKRELVEAHLKSCLYCLKRLNDMTELLYYQKHRVKLSPKIKAFIKNLLKSKTQVPSLFERVKEFCSFTPQQWRYSALGLAASWVLLIASSVVLRYGSSQFGTPKLNQDAFVKISALNSFGKVLSEQRGVVVSSDGYIEGRLQPMAGASVIRVTLRDGRTREIKQIWKDEDTNFAVMKIDDNDLTKIPIADIESIKIGQKVFAIPDSGGDGRATEAIISDFKQTPGRLSSSVQFIQVASQTSTKNTSKLLDGDGNLLGFVITEEKNINLAAPASSYQHLIKSTKATPVSELGQFSFSSEALDSYMKGILARDSQRLDEAILHFQEAAKMNPRLVGARLELGDLYYKKRLFKKEAKEYEEILKINPDNVDALYGLAWNKESTEKYKEATKLYEKALALEPKDTDILYQLGLSYLAQEDKKNAMKMYTRLNALEPGRAKILLKLAK